MRTNRWKTCLPSAHSCVYVLRKLWFLRIIITFCFRPGLEKAFFIFLEPTHNFSTTIASIFHVQIFKNVSIIIIHTYKRLRSKPLGNVQDALAKGGGRGLVKGTEDPAAVWPGVEGGTVPQRLPALVLQLHCGPDLLGERNKSPK